MEPSTSQNNEATDSADQLDAEIVEDKDGIVDKIIPKVIRLVYSIKLLKSCKLLLMCNNYIKYI